MAEISDQSATDNLNTKNGNFICGVVEGKCTTIYPKKPNDKSSIN